MLHQIGEKENIYTDESFKTRPERKTEYKLCADKGYEWSEYKSSLLAQYILNNQIISDKLLNFVNNIIQGLYTTFTNKKFVNDFSEYLDNAQSSEDNTDKYHVGQSQLVGAADRTVIIPHPEKTNNAIILVNFIAYTFYLNRNSLLSITNVDEQVQKIFRELNGELNRKMSPEIAKETFLQIVNVYFIFSLIQQNSMMLQFGIKGQRLNKDIDGPGIPSN